MAYSVSSSYHSKILDGMSAQDFMIVDTGIAGNYLSALDGDFVVGTPTVRRSVCESQDFTFGECNSSSLSFSMMNLYGDSIEYWGKRGDSNLSSRFPSRAGIGVLLSTGSSTTTTDKARVTLTFSGGTTTSVYVNSQGRLYVGSAYATGYSNAIGLHAFLLDSGWYWVFLVMSGGVVYRMTVEASTTSVPTRTEVTSLLSSRMKRKWNKQGSSVHDRLGFPTSKTIFESTTSYYTETWEYCPVGTYMMEPPKYDIHANYIDITDAMDCISLLDTNLKELASANSFSLTAEAATIINNVASAVGLPMASAYTTSASLPVTEDMISADVSARQLFKWVGERCSHMWKTDALGRLVTYVQPTFSGANTDYTLDDSRLAVGYTVYNEFVDPPEKLVIYYGDDETYTSAASTLTRTDYYKISGNPLFVDPSTDALAWPTYNSLPLKSYQTMSCTTVAADPSYGAGDCFYISTTNDYATYIMTETLSFGVRVTASYEATGSNTRLDLSAVTPRGAAGEAGVGVYYIKEIYYCSASNIAPASPTSASDIHTGGGDVYEQWTDTIPTWTETYQYYFVCNETQYTDGTTEWSDAMFQAALTQANKTAAEAENTANSAETTANTANENAQSVSGEVDQMKDAFIELSNEVYVQIIPRITAIDDPNNGSLVELAADINETAALMDEVKTDFQNFTNGALFKQFYVDDAGVHTTFQRETSEGSGVYDTGEILNDGQSIKFIINGDLQAQINSKGFIFRFGILTTALQIGNDTDEVGGTWTWIKAESGHFRLVYKGSTGSSGSNIVGSAIVGTATAG